MRAITGHTKLLGVIGHPIGHTLSPAMHNAALEELGLDCVYLAFDVDPVHLSEAVRAMRGLGIGGLNVTIPHKEQVIRWLDGISQEARLAGSVNTIRNDNGRLLGDSTDGVGFLQSLEAAGVEVKGRRAVVIGAGGSAKAVVHALVGNGAEVTLANRTVERGEELARRISGVALSGSVRAVSLTPGSLREAIEDADLLVNCTSVGMWPDVDASPCPQDLLHSRLLVYDLVYNPLSTRLMRDAESAGAATVSGLKMLVRQGAVSFKIWTGIEPPLDTMEKAALARMAERQAQSG